MGTRQQSGQHFRKPTTSCRHEEDESSVCNRTSNPEMDVETTEFMKNIQALWTQCKKCQALCNMLHSQFYRVSDPFDKALVMVRLSQDYKMSKQSSLAYTVMEQFAEWLKTVGPKAYSSLTTSLKEEAYQIASRQHNNNLSVLIVNAYKLTEGAHLLLPRLRNMLSIQMYKEVCDWAQLLNLQDQFGIMDFLVPLLLLDKVNVVDSFLKKNRRHNLMVVEFLDGLIGKGDPGGSIARIANDLNLPPIKQPILEKFSQYKTLMKIIKKLKAFHNIPDDRTPHCVVRNDIGTINFLLHSRYVKYSISREGFRDMLLDSTRNSDPKVIKHLITRLCEGGDAIEANYWVDQFQFPIEELQPHIQDEILHSREGGDDGWWNSPDHQVQYDYLQLPICRSKVILIDTDSQFESLIESAVDGETVIGLDCEWKPIMDGKTSSNLSLIQIATRDRVYLLDFVRLEKYGHLWIEFADVILSNPHVLKIGFGLSSDLNMMSSSLCSGTIRLTVHDGYLDLMLLWSHLSRDYNVELPYKELGDMHPNGLNHLVTMCTGKQLDKSEQFSNWQIRPLRETQILYAALDAYCLLDVYFTIRSICDDSNIPVDDKICELLSSSHPKKPKKTKKSKSRVVQPIERPFDSYSNEACGVDSLKLLCVGTMGNLAGKLRKCGIDSILLPFNFTNEEIKVAAENYEDDRILVLKSSVYNAIQNQFRGALNNCYIVETKNPQSQLMEILGYFNVIVTKDDLYCRCQSCNSSAITLTEPSEVNYLTNFARSIAPSGVPAGEEDDEYNDDDYWNDEEDYSDCNYHQDPMEQVDATWRTTKGVPVRHGKITDDVLQSADSFYICNDCGDISWDDNNFETVLGSRFYVN